MLQFTILTMFLAEDNSHVVLWEEIWNEVSLGYETSIRQQMDGICKNLEESFASPSWTMKAQVFIYSFVCFWECV